MGLNPSNDRSHCTAGLFPRDSAIRAFIVRPVFRRDLTNLAPRDSRDSRFDQPWLLEQRQNELPQVHTHKERRVQKASTRLRSFIFSINHGAKAALWQSKR
jgi:hypothetical protein